SSFSLVIPRMLLMWRLILVSHSPSMVLVCVPVMGSTKLRLWRLFSRVCCLLPRSQTYVANMSDMILGFLGTLVVHDAPEPASITTTVVFTLLSEAGLIDLDEMSFASNLLSNKPQH
ncbi:hypothetical protein PHYSODRAFT_476308, partial [Phytophthora sojae]